MAVLKFVTKGTENIRTPEWIGKPRAKEGFSLL
jgi:hypothetical protein